MSTFRGSVTRPMRSLRTLHPDGHPAERNTRFRLAVNLGRVGFSPTGMQKGFDFYIVFLLSRLGLAHSG